jgi:hypothetical protein
MDTQAIRAQMPTLVRGHVPSNVRSFKFNIFDGQPKVSTLGFHIDPKPFEGKVIATTDEAIVVKTGGPSSRCSTRRSSPTCPTKAPRCRSNRMRGAASTACARTRPRRAPSSPPTASPTR